MPGGDTRRGGGCMAARDGVLQMATGRRGVLLLATGQRRRLRRLRGICETSAGGGIAGRLAAAAAGPLIRRHRQLHLDRLTAARRYLNRGAQRIVDGGHQAGYVVLRDLPVAVEVVQGEGELLPPPVTFRDRHVAFEFLETKLFRCTASRLFVITGRSCCRYARAINRYLRRLRGGN